MTDLRRAVEQALEALNKIVRVNAMDYEYKKWAAEAHETLQEALAQPEQKPECVATIGNWGKVQWREDVFPQLGAKLYSAPPKREWVGLTDADKQEAFDETQEASGGFWEFADYLDAKLKEKNGG